MTVTPRTPSQIRAATLRRLDKIVRDTPSAEAVNRGVRNLTMWMINAEQPRYAAVAATLAERIADNVDRLGEPDEWAPEAIGALTSPGLICLQAVIDTYERSHECFLEELLRRVQVTADPLSTLALGLVEVAVTSEFLRSWQ